MQKVGGPVPLQPAQAVVRRIRRDAAVGGADPDSQADDGRWLGKIRADKQSDIRPLPQGSTLIVRPDNERNGRKLDSVYADVEAKTVNVRAAQVDV